MFLFHFVCFEIPLTGGTAKTFPKTSGDCEKDCVGHLLSVCGSNKINAPKTKSNYFPLLNRYTFYSCIQLCFLTKSKQWGFTKGCESFFIDLVLVTCVSGNGVSEFLWITEGPCHTSMEDNSFLFSTIRSWR